MTTTSKRRDSSSPFSAHHPGILEQKTQERAVSILKALKPLLVDDVIGVVQQYTKQPHLVFIDASQCDCEGEPWKYGCDGQNRDVIALDPATQTWTVLEPISCHYCTLAVCNGTVHAFQPYGAEHREWNVSTGTFQHYKKRDSASAVVSLYKTYKLSQSDNSGRAGKASTYDCNFPLKNQSFGRTNLTVTTVDDKHIFLWVKKHGFSNGALELDVTERKWYVEGDVVVSHKTTAPMTAWSKSVADFLRRDDKKPLILTANNDRIYAWHSKWQYAEVNCFHLDIDKGPFIWHMRRQRVQPAMAASRELNAIFACGGQYYNTVILANSCEQFDLMDKKWRFIAPMNEARQGGIAACVEDRLVVCGGHNVKLQVEVEMYNPVSDTWSVLPPCPRERFTPNLVLTV